MNINAGTINAISGALGMVNPILGVITSLAANFMTDKKAEQLTEISSKIQDGAKVLNALAPLVQQAADGKDVTESDVRNALAGMDDALSSFDDLIKAKGG